jgi:hypothetical protein
MVRCSDHFFPYGGISIFQKEKLNMQIYTFWLVSFIELNFVVVTYAFNLVMIEVFAHYPT